MDTLILLKNKALKTSLLLLAFLLPLVVAYTFHIPCKLSTAIDKSIIGKKVEIKGLLDVRSSVRFRDNGGYVDEVVVFLSNCKIIRVQE